MTPRGHAAAAGVVAAAGEEAAVVALPHPSAALPRDRRPRLRDSQRPGPRRGPALDQVVALGHLPPRPGQPRDPAEVAPPPDPAVAVPGSTVRRNCPRTDPALARVQIRRRPASRGRAAALDRATAVASPVGPGTDRLNSRRRDRAPGR